MEQFIKDEIDRSRNHSIKVPNLLQISEPSRLPITKPYRDRSKHVKTYGLVNIYSLRTWSHGPVESSWSYPQLENAGDFVDLS